MTIEGLQLLAWLRVGKSIAFIVFYIALVLGITKVYNSVGFGVGGFGFLLRYFLILRVVTLLLSIFTLVDTLAKPEEMMQQYIEQQSSETFSSIFEVPEELIKGKNGGVV